MVGYNPESHARKLTVLDHSVAGAFSGFVTRFTLQPLDVLKIRFQLQIEPIVRLRETSKYRSVFQASKCILKEEGIKSFWKGHVPAQGLSVIYGIVQFSSFEFYTQFIWDTMPTEWTSDRLPLVHTICGGMAGCTSMLLTHPLDLLRTRLVSQGEPKVYKGVFDAINKVYSNESLKGFYKGLTPTLLQIAPYVGAQFGFYKLFQEMLQLLNKISGFENDKIVIPVNILSGAAAGVTAKTLTYPLDVVKKRLQVQGFEEARKKFGIVRQYTGTIQCFSQIIKEETIFGLFKGLSPSMLKAALATSCHFAVYEQTCSFISKRKS